MTSDYMWFCFWIIMVENVRKNATTFYSNKENDLHVVD